jgi:preprotein translocase subunit YajC
VRNFPILIAFSLSVAAAAGAASAQAPAAAAPAATAPAAIAAGTVVKDTKGGDVGTVVRADGAFLVVKTDKHEARLPANAFTPNNGVLLFGMTRDELNAQIEKSLAAAAAKIAPGAAVSDPSGAAVGTLTAVDADAVTLKLASGTLVRLPKAGVAAGPNGVVVGMTAAQLEAAAKGGAAK